MSKTTKGNNLIREILVSISFDGDISVQTLEERVKKSTLINETFKKTHDAFSTSIKFDPADSKSKTGRVGFVLQSKKDQRIILQLKTGMISYHMLDQYVPSNEFADLFQKYWSAIVGDENIIPKELTIRYVNFIPVEDEEKLSDVITLKVEHPFENVENEFYNAKFHKNDLPVNIVIAYEGNKENRGAFFDHSIKQKFNKEDKEKVSNLKQIISQLRPIKNDIFFKILTEKTKNKYFNGIS